MMIEINLIDRETTDIGEDYGLVLLRRGSSTVTAFGGGPSPTRTSFFLGPEFFGFDEPGGHPDEPQLPDRHPARTRRSATGRAWSWSSASATATTGSCWRRTTTPTPRATPTRRQLRRRRRRVPSSIPGRPTAPAPSPAWSSTCSRSTAPTTGTTASRSAAATAGTPASSSTATRPRKLFNRSLPDQRDVTDFAFVERLHRRARTVRRRPGSPTTRSASSTASPTASSTSAAPTCGTGDRVEVDFFLDVFNVLNDQSALRIQDLTGARPRRLPRRQHSAAPIGVTFVRAAALLRGCATAVLGA